MTEFFKKIEGFDISKAMSTVKVIDPLQQTYNQMQERNNESMRIVVENNKNKEVEKLKEKEEELRRYNELMEELRNSKSSTIVNNIGDHATGVQIQQGTQNSTQTFSFNQEFNYEKASEVLNGIKEYFDEPKFYSTFNDKADEIKQIVNQTSELVERKENPTIIKKSLDMLYGLAIGVSGSLIASGIAAVVKGLLS